MSQTPAFDHNIPVLTEVFSDKPAAAPAQATEPAPSAVPERRLSDLDTEAIGKLNDPEWQLLERRLAERILQQLQGRVDFVLEQRLRDSMEAVLKEAVSGLTEEIRVGLQQTIEKIVVRAVAQEITHLQTLKT
ncbi:MAG: hypothetical protein ACJ8GW_01740 [Massilia sp.]